MPPKGPNLEAVLLKNVAILQTSKITPLRIPFHPWHHFLKASDGDEVLSVPHREYQLLHGSFAEPTRWLQSQPSMLETFIHSQGHECICLPKFHCELNPIEMVCTTCYKCVILCAENSVITGVGANTLNVKWRRKPSKTPRKQLNTYRNGFTGAAAAWAVRKQKQIKLEWWLSMSLQLRMPGCRSLSRC